jgi:hypothetical protein
LLVKLAATVEDHKFSPDSTTWQNLIIETVTGKKEQERSDDLLLQQLTVKTPRDSFFVSGQIESWSAAMDAPSSPFVDPLAPGARQAQYLRTRALLKLASFRTGLQTALRADSVSLLMSDLQLSRQIVVGVDHPTPNKGNLWVEPYPFQRVDRTKPLFLYFEIYNGAWPREGKASYRITYRIEMVTPRQDILTKVKPIFGKKASILIELESEHVATTPNSQEWVALDLQALSSSEVKLTVGVMDSLTKAATERSINLELF